MKTHWIIVLALLVIIAGCAPKESPEQAAKDAAQDAKVRAALAKQKQSGRTGMPGGLPAELGKEDAAAPDGVEGDDKDKSDAAAPKDAEGEADDNTETAEKLVAKQVLDDAVAKAKAENKALFVHFSADW